MNDDKLIEEVMALLRRADGNYDEDDVTAQQIIQLVRDSEWISVDDELPPEEVKINTLWFDIWHGGYRETGVKFKDGEFFRQVEDYQGDYSHDEKITLVTHWKLPSPPSGHTKEGEGG